MAFLQEPESPHQPAIRAPAVVVWLLATLALAHAARVYATATLSKEILFNFAFIPARYSPQYLATHHIDPGSWLERIVPFFSYVFLHGDFAHLAVNCLWLLAFGPIVARRFGAGVFLLFFFLCAAVAAATQLAFSWESMELVIGASGGIAGLMAAAIRIYNRRDDGRMASIFSTQIMAFTGFWLVVNYIAGVTGLGAGAEPHLTAWQAHIGGYFAGLLAAGPFDAFHRRRA